MSELKLQVGKYYRNRGGDVKLIKFIESHPLPAHPWNEHLPSNAFRDHPLTFVDGEDQHYRVTGHACRKLYHSARVIKLDLVEEVEIGHVKLPFPSFPKLMQNKITGVIFLVISSGEGVSFLGSSITSYCDDLNMEHMESYVGEVRLTNNSWDNVRWFV